MALHLSKYRVEEKVIERKGIWYTKRSTFERLLVNESLETNFGFEIGLVNQYVAGAHTAQVGLFNNVIAEGDGLQWGFLNISQGSYSGIQTGFYNQANRARGMQIGLLNRCKEGSEVIQIGLKNVQEYPDGTTSVIPFIAIRRKKRR